MLGSEEESLPVDSMGWEGPDSNREGFHGRDLEARVGTERWQVG